MKALRAKIMYINDLILFKREKKENVSIDLIKETMSKVSRPSWAEFENNISPIWRKVLNGPSSDIKQVFNANESMLKKLYENFFINGLSEGAAIGKKMYHPRSFLKIATRERRRLRSIKRLEEKEKLHFNFNLYDFGQPWKMRFDGDLLNFELFDHFYFANFCYNLLKMYNIKDLVFLGDGCGYLAQAVCSLDCGKELKSITMIDLYHFLFRQGLLLSTFSNTIDLEFLNGERSNYPTNLKRKALINQDSLPEINSQSQDKYFDYIISNNIELLISYNKVDETIGHEEFRNRANKVFNNKFICIESELRPGYWLEAWHV
jgi:hypothetical protein